MGHTNTTTGYSFHLNTAEAKALNTFLYHLGFWPWARMALAQVTILLGLDQDTEGIQVTLTQEEADRLVEAFGSFLPKVKKGETEDGLRSEVCQTINRIYKEVGSDFHQDLCVCLG